MTSEGKDRLVWEVAMEQSPINQDPSPPRSLAGICR